MSKRRISTAIIINTDQCLIEMLPVEVVLYMVQNYMEEPSLFNFCVTSTKYRDTVLANINLFEPIYARFTPSPDLYLTMKLFSVWRDTYHRNAEKPTVKDNFSIWYALKFRALFKTSDWHKNESVIAFNRIALTIRKLVYFESLYKANCIGDTKQYTVNKRSVVRYPHTSLGTLDVDWKKTAVHMFSWSSLMQRVVCYLISNNPFRTPSVISRKIMYHVDMPLSRSGLNHYQIYVRIK